MTGREILEWIDSNPESLDLEWRFETYGWDADDLENNRITISLHQEYITPHDAITDYVEVSVTE